jgi:hypothetical protein
MEYTSWIGILRGLSTGLGGSSNSSSASTSVGPLYQGMLEESSVRLSPFQPETGTNLTFSTLYPTSLRSFDTSFLTSS